MDLKAKYIDYKSTGAFLSADAFADSQNIKNKSIVKSALRSVDAYTKFKPARKIFKRQQTIVRYPLDVLAADLADFQKFKHSNRGYAWLACFFDAFSKKIYVKPLKTKSAKHVTEALKELFDEIKPNILFVDNGKEWYNASVKSLLKSKGIRLVSTFSTTKSYYAENLIRRLKRIIFKIFYITKRKNWEKYIDEIVANLNDTKSQPIGMTPNMASKPENQAAVFYNLYSKLLKEKVKPPALSVNDRVRISIARFQNLFKKGYEQTFSDEIFTVININRRLGRYTFTLADSDGIELEGQFYAEQLEKVL